MAPSSPPSPRRGHFALAFHLGRLLLDPDNADLKSRDAALKAYAEAKDAPLKDKGR